MIEQFVPVELKKFQGRYDKGDPETVPRDHFIDDLNNQFRPGGVFTRGGNFAILTPASVKVKRFFQMQRDKVPPPGTETNTLYVDELGNFFVDGNPLVSVLGVTDFVALNIFNRTVFSPHDGINGIADFVRVYDPNAASGTTQRPIAGNPPFIAVAMTAAESAVAGNVVAGTHRFTVAYETDTGFITRSGPYVPNLAGVYTPSDYVASGGKRFSLTGIPLAPAGSGVVKRHILATRANEEEFFFLLEINDNVTTAIINRDFLDTDLVESADYLEEQRDVIPSGMGMIYYNARLIVYGFPSPNGSLVLVSEPGEPESFNAKTGFLVVNKQDGYDVRNAKILRKVLYLFKSFDGPGTTHATIDNGDTAGTWDITDIDSGLGADVHSIASMEQSQGQTQNRLLVANPLGLLLFTGSYASIPLTWKISSIWKNLIFQQEFQVIENPATQEILILGKKKPSSPLNRILIYGDYSEGLTPDNIKWSVWEFHRIPSCIGLMGTSLDFHWSTDDNIGQAKIWKFDPTMEDDDGTPIASFFQTAFAYLTKVKKMSMSGWTLFFNALRISFKPGGIGNLKITAIDPLNNQASFKDIPQDPPVESFERTISFTAEKASVKIENSTADEAGNPLNGTYDVSSVIVYVAPGYASKPK